MTQSFSMRKIPFVQKENLFSDNSVNTNEIKILELSNIIDAWEKEVLFSNKGFFSLKGKDVENKSKEFAQELEKFINAQASKIIVSDEKMQKTIEQIKVQKINAIKQQMQNYEEEQLYQWQIDVYEQALKLSIQRALLYKDVSNIVYDSLKQGLIVLKQMAEKENWNAKIYKIQKDNYISDFYFQLINSFILDKDVKASLYFEKYKDELKIKDKEELEQALVKLKNTVIAYNWAREVFSYDLTEEENEKQLASIKDNEIEKLARKFLSIFLSEKKKTDENLEKEKNEQNWQEIIKILETEPDKAELYIDYSLSEQSQKAKKNYIKNIRKDGCVKTDKKEFLELLEKIYNEFSTFKQEKISDCRTSLSKEDYQIIEKLQSMSDEKYAFFASDYSYVKNLLGINGISNIDEIYELIKFLLYTQESYINTEGKEPDIEKRNKFILAALSRFQDKNHKHN